MKITLKINQILLYNIILLIVEVKNFKDMLITFKKLIVLKRRQEKQKILHLKIKPLYVKLLQTTLLTISSIIF